MDEKRPSWLQIKPHLANTLDTAAKLQAEIDDALRIEGLVKDPDNHAFLRDALAGGQQRALHEYANLLRDHLHRFRDAHAALKMVEVFRTGSDDERQEWLDDHPATLTADDLENIIQATMALSPGDDLSAHMKAVQAPRAKKAQKTNDEIRRLWEQIAAKAKSEGKTPSKNVAAESIALEVSQATDTVRGKLKRL